MANTDVSAWVPEEYDSTVLMAVKAESAVEALGNHRPMNSNTKSIPRSLGMAVGVVAKGGTYDIDATAVDDVVLTARKFGEMKTIDEEDLDDSLVDILSAFGLEFASQFAKVFDNACLAVTAAANGTTVPFTSVYKSIRTANADTSYSADANYLTTGGFLGTVTLTDAGDVVTTAAPHGLKVNDTFKVGTVTTTTGIVADTTYYVKTVPTTTTLTLSATKGGATLALTTDGSAVSAYGSIEKVSYDNLSDALGLVEQGDYFDPSKVHVIASPMFRAAIRNIKDLDGNPIFIQGQAGTPDTLFNHKITWSIGCRTHATATSAPTGNPLMVFCNVDQLIVGDRTPLESLLSDGRTGLGMATDESNIKYRIRKGFAVGHEKAFAVLEKVSA